MLCTYGVQHLLCTGLLSEDAVWLWCGCGVVVVRLWRGCGVVVVRLWPGCGEVVGCLDVNVDRDGCAVISLFLLF